MNILKSGMKILGSILKRARDHLKKREARIAIRLWPNPHRGLDFDQPARNDYITALRDLQANEANWQIHEWMHHDLTVLDDKTNSLLAVNSVAIAVLTIYIQSENALKDLPKVLLAVGLALLIWSILVLLRVAYVHWNSKEELRQPNQMFSDLLLVRNKRSAVVRASVLKIMLATLLFASAFLMQVTNLDGWLTSAWLPQTIEWLEKLRNYGVTVPNLTRSSTA